MESTLFTELTLTEQELLSGGQDVTQSNTLTLNFTFDQSNTNEG